MWTSPSSAPGTWPAASRPALLPEAIPSRCSGPRATRHRRSRTSDQLDGKVVVDITNPIDVDAFEPLDLEAGSAAQEIAAKAPGAKVVKAFNTTFAGTLGEGQVAGHPLDVLIASDAEDAKETVSRIVTDGGLRPIDAGPLQRAREIEALGYLHMAIQQPLGTGFSTTVKVLS